MNKFLLPAAIGVFLMVSGVFNIIQYNQTKTLGEKLALFETIFGTYESILEDIKLADEVKDEREYTVTVYTETGVPESQILAFKSLLESQNSVRLVKYVSAEQALVDFKVKYQDDKRILQALDELKTKPFSGSLIITITDPSQKQSLINFIQANDQNSIVQKINS